MRRFDRKCLPNLALLAHNMFPLYVHKQFDSGLSISSILRSDERPDTHSGGQPITRRDGLPKTDIESANPPSQYYDAYHKPIRTNSAEGSIGPSLLKPDSYLGIVRYLAYFPCFPRCWRISRTIKIFVNGMKAAMFGAYHW